MRRGTLIAIVVLALILAIAAAIQIAALSSGERPKPPVPSASPT
jgi:hypothetical protein